MVRKGSLFIGVIQIGLVLFGSAHILYQNKILNDFWLGYFEGLGGSLFVLGILCILILLMKRNSNSKKFMQRKSEGNEDFLRF